MLSFMLRTMWLTGLVLIGILYLWNIPIPSPTNGTSKATKSTQTETRIPLKNSIKSPKKLQ